MPKIMNLLKGVGYTKNMPISATQQALGSTEANLSA
jgi:hypothetical protein